MTWLILVDSEKQLSNADTPHKVMSTRDYLSRPQLFKDMKPRIINLARSYGYQGFGYYCSLLAEARGHRIIPAVETMVELSKTTLYRGALPELEERLSVCLQKNKETWPDSFDITVCFGMCEDERLQDFARLIFDWYRAPVLQVSVAPAKSANEARRAITKIMLQSHAGLSDARMEFFRRALEAYTRRSWRDPKTKIPSKYTLAVLSDPNEELPPTSQKSLKHLAKVAGKFGVAVAPIVRRDLDRLAEFDALFIRETTSVDNHTYRFARRARQEGMPVIDDPTSMIRCTNKVYLNELLTSNNIPGPKTVVVDGMKQAESLPDQLGWPIVLKIPDGSFSRGVFKVENKPDLESRLKAMLEDSDLVLAQEFMPTQFDWRIGILGGEPLFACQYLMAGKHWQIVHHEHGKPAREGGFKSVALAQTPADVLDAAVRSARLIGNSLYGVDIKQTASRLAVIEVNDNPNLEHGVEDSAEKDVWERLVQWFVTAIEQR